MVLRNAIFAAVVLNFAVFIYQYEARVLASEIAAGLMVLGFLVLLAGRRRSAGGIQRTGLSLIVLGILVLVAVILVALYRTWEWGW